MEVLSWQLPLLSAIARSQRSQILACKRASLLTASGGSPTLLVEDQEQEESESGLPYAYLHSFQELEVNIGTSALSVH